MLAVSLRSLSKHGTQRHKSRIMCMFPSLPASQQKNENTPKWQGEFADYLDCVS
jgi:hypothetical protein